MSFLLILFSLFLTLYDIIYLLTKFSTLIQYKKNQKGSYVTFSIRNLCIRPVVLNL